MCRYMCEECDEFYCVKCMPPPIMGEYCGGGHEYLINLNLESNIYQNSISIHAMFAEVPSLVVHIDVINVIMMFVIIVGL